MSPADIVQCAAAALLTWYALCRAVYMQWGRTAPHDVVALIAFGSGAFTHAIADPLLAAGFVRYDASLHVFDGPVFWCGLAAWVLLPVLRRRFPRAPRLLLGWGVPR